MVQWLRLHAVNVGNLGSIPGQGTNSSCPVVWQKIWRILNHVCFWNGWWWYYHLAFRLCDTSKTFFKKTLKWIFSESIKYSQVNSPSVCESSRCVQLVIPWTAARQAPLSMEFSRQEYWSGLPFHSPGNLPNPGIKL